MAVFDVRGAVSGLKPGGITGMVAKNMLTVSELGFRAVDGFAAAGAQAADFLIFRGRDTVFFEKFSHSLARDTVLAGDHADGDEIGLVEGFDCINVGRGDFHSGLRVFGKNKKVRPLFT